MISIFDGLKTFFGGLFPHKEVLPKGIYKRRDTGMYQVDKWYKKKRIPPRCFKDLDGAKTYVSLWKTKIDMGWC